MTNKQGPARSAGALLVHLNARSMLLEMSELRIIASNYHCFNNYFEDVISKLPPDSEVIIMGDMNMCSVRKESMYNKGRSIRFSGGGRKFSEKKFPRHEGEKKIAPVRGRKKKFILMFGANFF